MRIDLHRTLANEVAAQRRTNDVTSSQNTSSGTQEDTATLSTDSVSLSGLVSQAMQTPEIRQDKVDSLRQSIQEGTYKVDPKAVAEAILKNEVK